jgi:hypothetical protein
MKQTNSKAKLRRWSEVEVTDAFLIMGFSRDATIHSKIVSNIKKKIRNAIYFLPKFLNSLFSVGLPRAYKYLELTPSHAIQAPSSTQELYPQPFNFFVTIKWTQ